MTSSPPADLGIGTADGRSPEPGAQRASDPMSSDTVGAALWHQLPDLALLVSNDGHTLRANACWHALAERAGWPAGEEWAAHLDDASRQALQRALAQPEDFELDLTFDRPPVRLTGRSRWLADLPGHSLVLRDVTSSHAGETQLRADAARRHRLAEQALRESEERLDKFMQASAEGIVFHHNGEVTDANPPVCRLLGYSLDDFIGRKTLDFIAPDQHAKVASVIASGQESSCESVVLSRDGRRIPVEFIVRTLMRHGQKLGMTIVRDLRDREAARARIHHQAHHDTLTGLPNRTAFMERLGELIRAARSRSRWCNVPIESMALLSIDLDHFKRVNDSLGHLAGDVLLRTVADRITGSLGASDLVARFGGDEFMVLLTDLPDRDHVDQLAVDLLNAIEAPVSVESWPLTVTPSIGIALFPQDGTTPEALIKNADTAMYQAKARGRAHHCFFDPVMASDAYADLVVEGELAQALERGEFELYFQPQVHASRRALVGAEALIRWNHPTRGIVMPDDFIPVAEQQRLMLPISLWVMREAIRAALRWETAQLGVGPVAVNLSNVQFQSSGFVDSVEQLLREEGAPGRLLELELTERMLMDDLADVSRRLRQLSVLGVLLSVDDFGTGYSSLGHLKELPIDKMKIDRSFIRDLPHDANSAAITRAIVQMAGSLGITAMAEGVETKAQRDFLSREGCDELQGDLISKPLRAAAFEAWVRERGDVFEPGPPSDRGVTGDHGR